MDKMHVEVLISTYDRLESLRRCIKSIVECDYKDVSIFVVVDGNRRLFNKLLAEPVTMLFNEKRMDYVFSMNRALLEMGDVDAVLYGSDDLTFAPSCISEAVIALKKHFPDGDGVIGLNSGGPPTAFGLMGRKFINRFPDRQVFCPEYLHFGGDSELGKFAKKIDRFHFATGAVVEHVFAQKGRTTELSRLAKKHDRPMYRRRRGKGLYWGESFELLGEKK